MKRERQRTRREKEEEKEGGKEGEKRKRVTTKNITKFLKDIRELLVLLLGLNNTFLPFSYDPCVRRGGGKTRESSVMIN